jgi:hypothetical protein
MLAAGSSEQELNKRMQAATKNTKMNRGYFFMGIVVKVDY